MNPAGGAGRVPAPLPGLTAWLGVLALVIASWPGAAGWLALDREAVAAGELYRVFTGHFVHWSASHLAWDLGSFLVLGAACEVRGRGRYAAGLVASMVAISAGVWWARPGLDVYAGLSGLDCALFAWLALDLGRDGLRRGSRALPALALGLTAALGLKLGFEWTTGATLFVSRLGAGVAPVPTAHLVGAAIGAALPVAEAWGRSGARA